jgi:hypothetical protein
MDCRIIVLDTNGAAIVGANVVLDNQTAVTGTDGIARLITAVEQDNTLAVWHLQYIDERVQFDGSISAGKWNNALMRREVQSGQIVLTIRMGRCAVATTIMMEGKEIDGLALKNGDAKNALLWVSIRARPRRAYRGHLLDSKPIELAERIIIPEMPPKPEMAGWRRFKSVIADPFVEIMDTGRFFWLLYSNRPQEPQYAVLVWSPNIYRDKPLDALDMVVFYSPHTASYTAKYPFGVVRFQNPSDKSYISDQSYMSLGKKYLQEEFGFVYNLAGRKREAVMVMPICSKGNWGPFMSGEGLFRLCREVALFLHRECRTSNLSLAGVGGVDPMITLAGGSLRSPGASIWASDFGVPPPPGRLAISFFSTGADAVKALMRSWSLGGVFTQRYWGCPRGSGLGDPENMFRESWQELWDMDGFHPDTGGWPAYLDQLNVWAVRDTKRMVRLCHSSGRVPPNPREDKHKLWKRLIAEGITVERKIPGARELQGQRWSVVAFDDSYISYIPPGGVKSVGWQVPWLLYEPSQDPDAHHATTRVAFSHCVALSPVGDVSSSP